MSQRLEQLLGASQRLGAALARWAAAQGWGRLLLVAVLLLIAHSIVIERILHWEDTRASVHGHAVVHDSRQAASPLPAGTDSKANADNADEEVHIGVDGIKVIEHRGSEDATHADSMIVETVQQRSMLGWLHDLTQGLVMLLIVYLIAAKIVVRQTAQSDARAAQAEASAAAAAADAEHETLERQLAEARLQTLQAQVEPHFLFNTLASVAFLIETDPARASAMQKNLIAYLRAALPQMRTQHTHLGREGELSRAYLEILKMRMEDRLQVTFDIPEGLRSAEFPPMMLQTLVENAIQHGIEPKPAGGELRVAARVTDGQLEVTVADSGIGLADTGQVGTAGGGVGLANVRERLDRLYPGAASFALAARDPTGAVATIRIPYRVARQTDPATSGGAPAAAGAQA